MSDATEHRPSTPFPAEGAGFLTPPAVDPLAGDWSEGLRGPVRALGIATPRLLLLDGVPRTEAPKADSLPPPVAPTVHEVEAPDAWGATQDPLESTPPAASEPPSVVVTFTEPPEPAAAVAPPPAAEADAAPVPAAALETPAPDVTPSTPALALLPDVTPSTPAPAFAAAQDEGIVELGANEAVAADAPTPWSEPAAAAPVAADPAWTPDVPVPMPGPAADAAVNAWDQATAAGAPAVAWEMPASQPAVVEAASEVVDDSWSAPPPAGEPAAEWSAEAPSGDWEEVRKPAAPVLETPPAADWGTLNSGPDWSSPPPAEAVPEADAWGSAPPPAVASAWDAPAAATEPSSWEPAGAADVAAEAEWSAPAAPPPPAPAASWHSAPVGASAMEQLDSEPPDIEAAPGAAQELFGSVPVGASLSDDGAPEQAPSEDLPVDDLDAPEELAPADELPALDGLGPPEELASPEEVLKPVEPVDLDDPDLLVPVDEDEPPPPPRAPPPQPLGAMHPVAVGALVVPGEHRVAVHTRGGRTRRGSLKDVDLGKAQFSLIPQGGGAAEPVYHAEVKAIFFMLAPGEKPAPASGGKVRVTFADGRTIEGTRDGADSAKHGFFLIPADAARTNTRRIYVAREATTDVKDG